MFPAILWDIWACILYCALVVQTPSCVWWKNFPATTSHTPPIPEETMTSTPVTRWTNYLSMHLSPQDSLCQKRNTILILTTSSWRLRSMMQRWPTSTFGDTAPVWQLSTTWSSALRIATETLTSDFTNKWILSQNWHYRFFLLILGVIVRFWLLAIFLR